MNYFPYIFLGILPSFIWLVVFLRMDKNPESRRMILKIFLFGMLIALPIVAFVVLVETFFPDIPLSFEEVAALSISILIFYILFWALIEEVLKYLVVKYKVLSHFEFDEPIDVMIYMITAGLGFAALENILVLFGHHLSPLSEIGIWELIFWRFITATILHALCSGMIGYFLALSFFHLQSRKKFLFYGIFFSSLLHGLYNFSIILIEGLGIFALIILIILAVFIIFSSRKLKRLKSVCKFNTQTQVSPMHNEHSVTM